MTYRDPTDDEYAELLRRAYEMGLDGDGYDEDARRIDWDSVIRDLEDSAGMNIALPEDWEHPKIKALKREYRRGRREAL